MQRVTLAQVRRLGHVPDHDLVIWRRINVYHRTVWRDAEACLRSLWWQLTHDCSKKCTSQSVHLHHEALLEAQSAQATAAHPVCVLQQLLAASAWIHLFMQHCYLVEQPCVQHMLMCSSCCAQLHARWTNLVSQCC